MVLEFKTHGNAKQKEAIKSWVDNETTEILYGGAKGGGKSYLGGALIMGTALIYPNTHWFIARKKLNDLRRFTIPTLHEVFNNLGITEDYFSYNGQDNFFELYNGSRIYLIDAKYLPSDPMYARFGSIQMTGGWIEEAGEFEKEAYQSLAITIGRKNNALHGLKPKLLLTCNPALNFLYDLFYIPNKNNTLPLDRKFITALPTDNTFLSKEYIENLEKTLSENQKQRLLYGLWEFDTSKNSLFLENDLQDMFTNSFLDSGLSKKYVTADLALSGADKFVMIYWEGLVAKEFLVIDKCDGKELIKHLQDFCNSHRVPLSSLIYDGDGLGGFVKGFLKQAISFNNNGKPINDRNKEYQNLKTQCYFKMAEFVRDSKIYISDSAHKEKIIRELKAFKDTSYLQDENKRTITKKVDVIREIGNSPDFADALIMRCWFELKNSNLQSFSVSR